jgi:TonB family protein
VLGCLAVGAAWYAMTGNEGQQAEPPRVVAPAAHVDAGALEIQSLVATAERALAESRMDDAEMAIARARALQPDDARVAFLAAQIGKERERTLLTQARAAAASGDHAGAMAVLEGASIPGSSALVAETRRELAQQALDAEVATHLRASQDALTAGDLAGSERALQMASALGASDAQVNALRRELQIARRSARAAAVAAQHEKFTRSLAEHRLLEPKEDSARHWLARLVATDPRHSATEAARSAFASAAVQEAQAALAQGDLDGTATWLAEARAAAAPDAQLQALARLLDEARAEADARRRVVDASTLRLVKQTGLRYPSAARGRGQTGWVEVEFTVRPDGSVGEIIVTQSEPAGVFDAAAADALAKWRYRPVVRNGRPVPQRARLRVRFTLE